MKHRFLIFITLLFLPSIAYADSVFVEWTMDAYMSQGRSISWTDIHDTTECNVLIEDIDYNRVGVWATVADRYWGRRCPVIVEITESEPIDRIFVCFRIDTWINKWLPDKPIIHIVECNFDVSLTVSDYEYGDEFAKNGVGHSGGSASLYDLSPGDTCCIELDSIQWLNTDGSETHLGLIEDHDYNDDSAGVAGEDPGVNLYSEDHALYPPYIKYYTLIAYSPDSLKTEDYVSYEWSGDDTPEFKAICRDGRAYCDSIKWQVGTVPNDSNMWNPLYIDITNVDSAEWIEEISYSDTAEQLDKATWYYVRCRTKEISGEESGWSAVDSFRNVVGCTLNVVWRIDTESGDANMNEYFDEHPTIGFDFLHIVDSDTGGVRPLMWNWWLEQYKDDLDSLPRFNFNSIMGEAVCSASGEWSDTWEACRCVGDSIYYYFNPLLADSGVQHQFGIHYTHWDSLAGDLGFGFGGHDDYDTIEARSLTERLIWNNRYPFNLAHNAGWNKGNDRMNMLLEQFVMFDYSCVNLTQSHEDWNSAPKYWWTYPPDSTEGIDTEGNMIHYIGQAGWWFDFEGQGITPFVELFDSAATNTGKGWAIAGIYGHTFTEGTIKLYEVVDRVYDSLSVNSDSCNIPFRWCNFTEAERFTKGWTDVTAPTITITASGSDSIQVLVNEKIGQETPIGLTLDADTLARIDFAEATAQVWRYSKIKFPDKAIFVVTDTCNNARLDSYYVALAKFGIQPLHSNGKIMLLYEDGEVKRIFLGKP